jgi:hypothetical protein
METPIITGFGGKAIYLGDVIVVTLDSDGCHRIIGVEYSVSMRHHSFALPKELVESNEFQVLCDEVAAADGKWESVFKGLFYVHLPVDSAIDIDAAIKRRAIAARDRIGA